LPFSLSQELKYSARALLTALELQALLKRYSRQGKGCSWDCVTCHGAAITLLEQEEAYPAVLQCRRTGKKPILSMKKIPKLVTPFISNQKISIPFEMKHSKAMMFENKVNVW